MNTLIVNPVGALTDGDRPAAPPTPPPDLEVVVPVYDEERTLAASIQRLHRFLSDELPLRWQITIADNASRDATPEIAPRWRRRSTT